MTPTFPPLWRCMIATYLVIACGLLSRANAAGEKGDDASRLIIETERASNQSLLWGPYRSNLYFGVRPRIPKSLMTGLLWAKIDELKATQENFRYTCEQNEGMDGYGWDEYDIRHGGKETIHDAGNTLDLTIDFVKVPGGNHGGSWAARIKGQPATPDQITTLIFLAGLEGEGGLRVDEEEPDPLGFKGNVRLVGNTPDLGDFALEITRGPTTNDYPRHDHPSYDEKPLDRTIVSSVSIRQDAIWQGKAITFTIMKREIDALMKKYGSETSPPVAQVFTIANSASDGTAHLIQKVFKGPFEFDILFSSGSAGKSMTSTTLDNRITETSKIFSGRFKDLFSPVKPFDTPEYLKFAKAMLSNLVGGIGYFYGDSMVDRSYASEYEEEEEGFWEEAAAARARTKPTPDNPAELFTSIPSRPFFPRGFLWDEGFHLLPIMDWDLDLTLQIVKSWFNLMDEDGWIAREQILGDEARSKVPAEFQVQYPHYANPPTLFMVLETLIDKLRMTKKSEDGDTTGDIRLAATEKPDLALSYLRSLYPLLKRQYFWFKKTQWGDIKSYDREAFSMKEAYRWRGRTVDHILTSGLDDYPRPQPPHPGELHVDLISWVGMMTRALRRIADVLGETEEVEQFSRYENAILRNIDDLHWNEKAKMYCDATVDEYEENAHVCHKGYVSIMPFMTGLIAPESPRLGPILELINNPKELWSDFGILSLSKSDEFYGTGENYWRGPIWINMNYLILKNLYNVARVEGPHRNQAGEMYNKLRKNVVKNVYKEWKETGFAWEQYNPETGSGQRTQHFTGWTSLVVKIMTMPEVASSSKGRRDEL